MVQSVDRVSILQKANEHLLENNIKRDVLLQVNISEESQKSGFSYKEISDFFKSKEHLNYSSINITGLMGIGPANSSSAEISGLYKRFKACFDDACAYAPDMKVLSAGMSGDFEEAIRQGSTMIRVGSIIFKE
jgi:hypothetical protein